MAGKRSGDESIEDVIDGLHAYMDDAFEMLEKGEYVELLGLSDRVEELCKDVLGLPVERAMKHREALDSLIDQLDDLKTLMEAHKEVIGEQMGAVGGSQAAAKAYQKSHHILPFKKTGEDE